MSKYHNLRLEFSEPFSKTDLSFHKEFKKASSRTDSEDEIRKILVEVLKEYANSKAKTKGGRLGRFFARIGAIVLPFVSFKKK